MAQSHPNSNYTSSGCKSFGEKRGRVINGLSFSLLIAPEQSNDNREIDPVNYGTHTNLPDNRGDKEATI